MWTIRSNRFWAGTHGNDLKPIRNIPFRSPSPKKTIPARTSVRKAVEFASNSSPGSSLSCHHPGVYVHPGRLNGWNLQPSPIYIKEKSSEPNLHEEMFHVNLEGCNPYKWPYPQFSGYEKYLKPPPTWKQAYCHVGSQKNMIFNGGCCFFCFFSLTLQCWFTKWCKFWFLGKLWMSTWNLSPILYWKQAEVYNHLSECVTSLVQGMYDTNVYIICDIYVYSIQIYMSYIFINIDGQYLAFNGHWKHPWKHIYIPLNAICMYSLENMRLK